MGFKDWFKSKPKFDIEEFSKSKEANEKWIEHYFKIGYTKPSGISDKDFELLIYSLKKDIANIVLGQVVYADSIGNIDKEGLIYKGSLKKNVTVKFIEDPKEGDYFLVRFVDIKEGDLVGKGLIFREKNLNDKRSYEFSPYQSLLAVKIFPQITLGLEGLLKIKPHTVMTYLTFEGKEPIVKEFDGLQYFVYPIAKRIKLCKKYPDVNKFLFAMDLTEFIDWIMKKKNENEHMKKYCKTVEDILKKEGVK